MTPDVSTRLVQDIQHIYAQQRRLAEGALQQVSDQQFFLSDGAEANSLAIIVKHVGGNLRSRWTDFLSTDGEKPDRNRDSEFVVDGESREHIMRVWESGWYALEYTLDTLTAPDLSRTITIRGEPCTVLQALLRNLAHTSHHCGQIVHISKALAGEKWQTLSIPRAGSAQATGNFWK